MKQTIKPNPTPMEWDANNLFSKAQRYFELMYEQATDTWQYALFSSLALELLARATLANVSPAFLTDDDRNEHANLFYSLGFPSKSAKYVPRSISMTKVCGRLSELFPQFDDSLSGFCVSHSSKRNAEVHSGATPFDGVEASSWLPRYLKCCSILLETMTFDLSIIMPSSEVAAGQAMIAADEQKVEKAALDQISAHKKVWDSKTPEEKTKLLAEANAWSTRQAGHRVNCPACGSPSIVFGPAVGETKTTIKDDLITETLEHLPTKFECVACSLKINGVIKLSAAKLANRYKKTSVYDALEYYASEAEHYEYAPDNND